MRKLLLFVWLLLPVGAAAYHYGPGQDHMRVDRAARASERAHALAREAREMAAEVGDVAARPRWSAAEEAFTEALSLLPADEQHAARGLRIERAKAQMFVSKLPEVRGAMQELVDELERDPHADPAQLADARGVLANAQYYVTWLLRLEGAPREEWEPEIEGSRQTYKLLATEAQRRGEEELAARLREDLESAIRLARMDLEELQGLPLPSQ